MIYTVGFNTYKNNVDVNFALNYFKNHEEIQYDSETKGFDCHSVPMLCFQLGDFENQFVINIKFLNTFKNILETKLLIGQNIKFDLKFLYKNHIFPTKVYDTMLAEFVISCGIDKRRSLAAIAKERLGIEIDKSVREGIWDKEFTEEVIEYSANDVKYLQKIKESQQKDLDELDLNKALMIENAFVLCLAYIEFCGFKLDKNKWQKKCEKDLNKFNETKEKLDQFVIKNKIDKFIDYQGDLFITGVRCKVNWASPKQVAEFFIHIGVPININDGVNEKVIAKHQKDFQIIQDYLEYKGLQKLITTYGENFFRHINPNTGRLHTNFKQVMDTGRISSGGKNSKTGEEYINFQNIPSDKETRSCFVAEEGNTLLISDYSGQEQVVLANYSLDKNILEFYDNGLADMHSFVASKMYKELEGLTLDEIKTEHKDKRQKAKSAGFAINYGGNGLTISQNLNLPIEDGENIYKSYFEAFPDLKNYFAKVQQQALEDGYVLISPRTKRKCFIQGYENFIIKKEKFNKEFWEKYKILKKKGGEEFNSLREEVSKWFRFKGQIERMALNFPIQGSSAEITKISCIYFFRWIIENNYINIVKFVNTVHDENVVECPLEIKDTVAKALAECMNKAADLYCKRVHLRAEPEASLFWKK